MKKADGTRNVHVNRYMWGKAPSHENFYHCKTVKGEKVFDEVDGYCDVNNE